MRGKKKKRKSNRLDMICITAVVTVLLVSLTIMSQNLKDKNLSYAEQEAKLQKQIAEEAERAEEIAELEEYMKTDEYVEKIAKDKLGLAYEDEILFKPKG